MNILITGGTGFIGRALCQYLLINNHDVVVKTRRPEIRIEGIRTIKQLSELTHDDLFDVVINLAGEPIADKRWSEDQKNTILQSRIETTEELISYFNKANKKPSLLISGSAIGFYGVDSKLGADNDGIREDHLGDESFSSRLCQQWEESALQAEQLGIRTCLLRTGIVLGGHGGALGKMILPFKLGLGGRVGSGKQWMPWIHLDDLIGIIGYCITQTQLSGPINGTAPNPVTNKVFTKALGKALNRPTILAMPAWVIKLTLGEMGEELLLAGKKVLPYKAQQAGYQFKYDNIDSALSDILKKR